MSGNIKQVHLGLGQFFRGHMAAYTQKSQSNKTWNIAAVSMRTNHAVKAMQAQGCRYHIVAKNSKEVQVSEINCVTQCYFLKDDYKEILELMSSEKIEIISLTITEKGYCYNFKTKELDRDDYEIQSDLGFEEEMQTSIGLLAKALIDRYKTHKKPLTLISCDNVAMNGDVLAKSLYDFLSFVHPETALWFQENIKCPNTMVDRIVPKTTETEKKDIQKELKFEDKIPIITESFTQWCIEDKFAGIRPNWDTYGAELVESIEPFENLKLRVLNASHSYLTYKGLLIGYKTVDEAIADPEIRDDLEKMLTTEVAPTLKDIGKTTFERYKKSMLERFSNHHLKHQLSQIAMDGSVKVAQRFIPTILENREANKASPLLFKALSTWICFIKNEINHKREIKDPLSKEFKNIKADDALEFIKATRALNIIPDQILDDDQFLKVYKNEYQSFF